MVLALHARTTMMRMIKSQEACDLRSSARNNKKHKNDTKQS
jgi:hypothetical protein